MRQSARYIHANISLNAYRPRVLISFLERKDFIHVDRIMKFPLSHEKIKKSLFTFVAVIKQKVVTSNTHRNVSFLLSPNSDSFRHRTDETTNS